MPWTDEQWQIILKCQDQEGRGYDAHAVTWSNHSYRYVPTLCADCGKLVRALDPAGVDEKT